MNNANSSQFNLGLWKFLPGRYNLVFIVVPFFLFLFMLFRIAEIHLYYQGWYDPVYAYLMGGLTFALGSNDTGFVTHPGIPLQLFGALLIKITGWLRGSNDLATEVLAHPEIYIRIITIALIGLNCVMLWMLGLFAFKNLKNRNMAVAVQLFPLLSFQLVNFMPVFNSESVLTLLSLAIAACMILYDNSDDGRFKLLAVIALLSALSVSTKISAFPVLIIPFFFFETQKSKLSYLLLSLLFLILFIIPILDKLTEIGRFIGGIATHTGKYGLGEKKLFDATIFFQGIHQMVLKELTFTLHLLLLPVGWVMIRKRHISGSLKRLYIAITLATIFQVLLVARHYSFHYLMPVFALFMPLHGYFWIQFFREKIGTFSTRIVSRIVIFLVFGVFARLIVMNKFGKGITNPVEKTSQAVKTEFKGKYIVLTAGVNGSAFIETALRFGYAYTGRTMKKQFTQILASVYPGNYLWNSADGFTDWAGNYLPLDVFRKNSRIYVYSNTGLCEASMLNISAMVDQVGMTGFVKLEKVYQNERSGEVIALATADTAQIIKSSQPRLVIETSMEELTADGENIKSNTAEFMFKGGKLQSNRFAHSGKSSLLLTSSNQFGLNISIPVSNGKRYKVEFWQRSSDQKQTMAVASATNSEQFYKTSDQGENKSGEWTRSELNVSLPENYPEPNLNFYLWSPASDSVWVDDFRIMVFQ